MKTIDYSFPTLSRMIEADFLYVDKTEYIYKLINRKPQGYYFLSRPRRFGKSLTLTTLKSLFQGEKEVFKELAIYDQYDWKRTYPVVHIDLGPANAEDPKALKLSLFDKINLIARREEIQLPPNKSKEPEVRFEQLIDALSANGPVVILVDEYDSPVLDQIHEPDASGIIDVMRKFYGTLERCKSKIAFVYITGISKYHFDEVFADVPSLEDISFDPEFATMIGYTQKELEENFAENIDIARRHKHMSRQAFLAKLKKWYGGYRFHEDAEMVYNPVAIAYLFNDHDYRFDNYWSSTGSPSLLADHAKNTNFHLLERLPEPVPQTLFRSMDLKTGDLRVLMYLTGYLTIRDSFMGEDGNTWYHLKFTNHDVSGRLLEYLLIKCFEVPYHKICHKFYKINSLLYDGRLESFIIKLINFTAITGAGILVKGEPQLEFYNYLNYELGEVATIAEAGERIWNGEPVIHSRRKIYVIASQLDGTAQEALDPLEKTGAWKNYLGLGKTVCLIWVNYNSDLRIIDDWVAKVYSDKGELQKERVPASKYWLKDWTIRS